MNDPFSLAALRAGALGYYKPRNSQEALAVERIAFAQRNIFHVEQMLTEWHAAAMGADPAQPSDEAPLLGRGADVLSFLLKYQVQAERLYRRAVEDFQRLERRRQEENVPEEMIEEVPAPQPSPQPEPCPTSPEPIAANHADPAPVAVSGPQLVPSPPQ
jgi:hypothetical protein